MAIQTINLGSAPTGAGGDTFRSAASKLNENFNPATLKKHLSLDKFAQNPNLNTVMSAPNADAAIIITDTGWGIYKGDAPGFFSGLPIANGGTGAINAEQARVNLGLDRFYQQGDLNTFVMSPNKDFYINLENNSISLYRLSTNASYAVRTGLNTVVDGNGFIKSASPVVQLFSEKIELNDEAELQDITFEKLSVGDYLIRGSTGFAQKGWYVEMPKDANGNVLVAVQYQQLEDNTIEVKTFAKKFDEETGDIIPNLEKPRDIPAGRWIDIRLKELPKPDIEIPISNTPPEFQPTNLAQAVAEALKNGVEQ